MKDDEQRREEQEDREENHQRERELAEAKARGDEKEPLFDDESVRLGDLDEALKSHDYPTTTAESVAAYGDYELEIQGDKKLLEYVLSSTDDQTYDSAEDVRRRILGVIGR
ncbi:DUF5789 family protein [Halovenus halobia]|uniref:DUF5789 family protein n=1 Tax=Halovenus halobia TaxID=3396622 RepID=UPI003F566C78